MRRRAGFVAIISVVAALAASAALASAASAAPVWKFNGATLSGSETVSAETAASSFTISGLTTTCKATVGMTISNSGSQGVATVESMSLSGCGTNGVCTVEAANAEELPWSGSTLVAGGSSYLKIEGFRNKILYGGELCAISGLAIPYRGSVGELFDNGSSRLLFNAASAAATGASLKSIGTTPTGYDAEYEVRATGGHAGQALTLS